MNQVNCSKFLSVIITANHCMCLPGCSHEITSIKTSLLKVAALASLNIQQIKHLSGPENHLHRHNGD